MCKADARAIAEKTTVCNHKPEETTHKSQGKEKELHRSFVCLLVVVFGFFFAGEVMKNKIIFQLYFNLPTYTSNGECEIDKITSPFGKIRKTRCRR